MSERPTLTPESPAEAQAPAARPKRLRRGPVAAVAVVALALAVGGFRYWQQQHDYVSTNNAYVRGDIVTVSPKIAGRLAAVHVATGDAVRRGQLLAELDAAEIRIQLRQAEANLAAARTAVAQARAGVALQAEQTAGQEAQAGAGVTAAERQLEAARVAAARLEADYARLHALYREGGVSQQQYDQARAAAETARVQARAAEAQVASARAASAIAVAGETQVRMRELAVAGAEAQVAQAEAAVAAARQQLANTRLVAPVDGVVAKKSPMGGEMVQPGQAIAEVVAPDSVYIEAMIDETAVARVQVGEPVTVDVDAYPGRHFQGRVAQIGAAAGSEFALIPPNNAAGNFTKVVQRLPVKIEVENPAHMLKPGMSSQVAIDVRPQGRQAARPASAHTAI